MSEVRLAATARRDFASILKWTRKEFGDGARLRYQILIEQALNDLAESPDRAGSMKRKGILPADVRLYPLALSRKRVKGRSVAEPRHIVVYRVQPQLVLILRILHDSRDLKLHVGK